MEKLPWLLELASLVLAWTAANLLMADPRIGPQIGRGRAPQVIVHAAFLALIVLADIVIRVARRRRERRAGQAEHIASVEESLADSARLVVANLDSGDDPTMRTGAAPTTNASPHPATRRPIRSGPLCCRGHKWPAHGTGDVCSRP